MSIGKYLLTTGKILFMVLNVISRWSRQALFGFDSVKPAS